YPVAILPTLRPGAGQHGARVEIFAHAERRKDLPALGDLADAEIGYAMARQAADLGAPEHDAAAGRTVHAGNGLDQRGLAGAVGADDRRDRPLIDRERHR